MICTPDRRTSLRLCAALALVLAAPGGAAPKLAETLVRDAHVALARGDGIAAEAALTKALGAGATRDAIAARMGEAFLDQGDLVKAREWLGPARFPPGEAAHGLRMLGRLELAERHFPEAGAAFDRALALTPDDSRLWVDIARLRYGGGQQIEAIAAADKAVRLDPGNVRALEFRGMLVRDQFGPAAALPWFEAGLLKKPDDVALLGEYAATLGELGRAREMLTVTRRMIELAPRNPRAFFLQAVLAARAGNLSLARSLLSRTDRALIDMPAAILLDGVLTLEAGNANLAADQFERLVRAQPQNQTARQLLARALYAAGERQELLDRFAGEAARADASPYLLTLLARAAEDLGRRDLAAPLLDRAAAAGAPPLLPAAETTSLTVLAPRYADAPGDAGAVVPYIRQLLAAGRTGEAGAAAERVRAMAPGSADAQALAGDLRLAAGDNAGAVERYRLAAAVRLSDDLLLRLVTAYVRGGGRLAAAQTAAGVLGGAPRHPLALRLAAGFAAEAGDWGRAARLLGYLAEGAGARDARLWADLALARQRSGDKAGARAAGERATFLQRGAPLGAQAWGMALADSPGDAATARALLAKAHAIGGSNPLLQQSEEQLSRMR